MARDPFRRLRRWLLVPLAVYLVVWHVHDVWLQSTDLGSLFDRQAYNGILIAVSAACLFRAVRVKDERKTWACISLGLLAWSFGDVYYTEALANDPSPPVPSPADAGYLLLPPLLLVGLIGLSRSRMGRVHRTLWADGMTAALAVAALSAAIVFEAVRSSVEGNTLEIATNLAYPLTDLVLISVIVGVMAGRRWKLDRTWLLLGFGMLLFAISDSVYLVQVWNGTVGEGRLIDAGWSFGIFLMASAGLFPNPRQAAGSPESMRLIAVPLSFAGLGLGILVYASVAYVNPLGVALAATSLVAIMARALLTFRENIQMLRSSRREALTDSLTGLRNRRALTHDLDRAVAEADDGSPAVLVLFDLDGFKHYNDSFGHPAGDALLVRLGANLDVYARGRGRAYRMGGDEFCLLFRPGTQVAEPIIEGAAAALCERGEGFAIGCSYGSVTLPREAEEASEALRLADQRLYAHKNGGRVPPKRQSKAVLLRALAERHPDLGDHLADVAALAVATARRLALGEDEVELVRHAAELHDVGKVAIPDAILSKPGPLDPDEWDFVRRHTLIGERIIAAAPALAPVARVVRSSHERWDGSGYPDKLRGEAIPLCARIVSVADAFDAMTSDRPYSPGVPPESALDELRRCAGAQFDPVVVQAFAAAWESQGSRVTPGAGPEAP
jgi:two-component system cell cycle response regulator